MKKIFAVLILAVSFSALACFQLEKIKLKDHLFIKGVSVNHRFVFLDEKNKEITTFGLTKVTDKTGKKNLKSLVDFSNGTLRLNPEEALNEKIIQIEFSDLKKIIRLEIDQTKTPAKSMMRSSGGCGGKLILKTY